MARSKKEFEANRPEEPQPIAALALRDEPDTIEPDIVLSARHQAFVDAYLGPARFDGKQAARIAGYKPTDNNLSVVSCVLLKRADVQAVIAERTKRQAMDSNEALSHLADIARTGMECFLDEDMAEKGIIRVDIAKAKRLGKLHLIKKLKTDAEGNVTFELYNRLEALVIIIKQLGLLKDRVDVGITLDMLLDRLPDGVRESVGRELARRVLSGSDQGVPSRRALPPRGSSE